MTPAKGVGRRDSSVSLFATSPSFFISEADGGRRDSTVAFPEKSETENSKIAPFRSPSSPPSHQQAAHLV